MKSKEWLEAREARKKMWVERLNYMSRRCHAAAWAIGAALVLYYTNFFYVIFNSPQVNSLFFGVTLTCFGVFASLTLFASFGLPKHEEIEVTAPRLIPVASAVAMMMYLSSHIAFWPVWGWYTPAIIAVLTIGFMMAGTFLPKGTPGSVLVVVLFVASVSSSKYISHEGLWH